MAFNHKLKPQGRLKPMASGSDIMENLDKGYRLKKKRDKDNSLYSMYGFIDTNFMPPPTLISLHTGNPSPDTRQKNKLKGRDEEEEMLALESPHCLFTNIQRHPNTRETTRISLHENLHPTSPLPSLFSPRSSPVDFGIVSGDHFQPADIFNLTSTCQSEKDGQQYVRREQQNTIEDNESTSNKKSIHWILSPKKHLNFDKKGQLRAQGPFSREFSVTCSPPRRWMKKKAGSVK